MAEERNVGLARATDPRADGDDLSKEELQRRMEEVRESITQTVTEIKDTVATQYQQVRNTISETLDWREQYRRRPVEFGLGAFGAGLLLGYGVMGALAGGRDDDEDDELAEDELDAVSAPRSYAAQAITGGHRSAAPPRAARAEDVGPDSHQAYSTALAPAAPSALVGGAADSSAGPDEPEAEEPKGPGLLARFKETRAYDRLQDELSSLGDRAVEELSKTAQTVVLPAILGKLKDLIGIDLSKQREVAQRSRLEHQTAQASAATSAAAEQPRGGSQPQQGASAAAAPRGAGASGASS